MKSYAITINVAIIVLIVVVIAVTQNPLALLGLFFLQQAQFAPEYGDIQQQLEDAVGEDPEYNEHGTGFTAKL